MSSVAHPRGRLPARVYWFRRGLLLATSLALVFGFAQLLGVGGGSGPGPGRAELAGATAPESTNAPVSTPSIGPAAVATSPAQSQGKKTKAKSGKLAAGPTSGPTVVLASPDGPCAADEIAVAPSVSNAKAYGPVVVDVKLTATRPACTFEVSSKTLALKVTSGSDGIWSSQDCPGVVPKKTVVVRSAVPALVPVTWNGRRSDGSCGVTNAYARPGYYHAMAAVIGSVPADTQFALSMPPRPVITKTARPKPHHPASTSAPSATKSGPVTGKGTRCGGDNAAGTC